MLRSERSSGSALPVPTSHYTSSAQGFVTELLLPAGKRRLLSFFLSPEGPLRAAESEPFAVLIASLFNFVPRFNFIHSAVLDKANWTWFSTLWKTVAFGHLEKLSNAWALPLLLARREREIVVSYQTPCCQMAVQCSTVKLPGCLHVPWWEMKRQNTTLFDFQDSLGTHWMSCKSSSKSELLFDLIILINNGGCWVQWQQKKWMRPKKMKWNMDKIM